MARFTDEQVRLGEGMKTLIDLYDLLSAKRDEKWFSEIVTESLPKEVIEKMATFFDRVIPNFSPSLFFPKEGIFRFRTGETSIRVNFQRYFTDFFGLMVALREDCQKINEQNSKTPEKDSYGKNLLTVEKISYETSTPPDSNAIKLPGHGMDKQCSKEPEKQAFKIIHSPLESGDIVSEERYVELKDSDLNFPTQLL